jgi:hypothetical protein
MLKEMLNVEEVVENLKHEFKLISHPNTRELDIH